MLGLSKEIGKRYSYILDVAQFLATKFFETSFMPKTLILGGRLRLIWSIIFENLMLFLSSY